MDGANLPKEIYKVARCVGKTGGGRKAMLTMYFYLSYQGGVERDMSVAVHHLCRMHFPIPFASDACHRSTAGCKSLIHCLSPNSSHHQ